MKTFLTISIVFLYSTAFCQLNPVQNLNWDHDYQWPVEPYNTFVLSWSEPETSNDVLKGYNIYAHNELWKFQETIGAECTSMNTSDCDFLIFMNAGDWIKVTAVYNEDLLESTATDSTQFEGLALNITKANQTRIHLQILNDAIHIVSNESIKKAELLNLNGQCILTSTNDKIYTSNLSTGMYICKIYTGEEFYIREIIIN